MKYFKKFTLLELLIVSVLLSSLLASVSYIMFQALETYEENSRLMVFEYRVNFIMNKFKKTLKTAWIEPFKTLITPLVVSSLPKDTGQILGLPEHEYIYPSRPHTDFPTTTSPYPLLPGSYYFISYSKPNLDDTARPSVPPDPPGLIYNIDPNTGNFFTLFDPDTGALQWDAPNFIGLGPPVLPVQSIPAPPQLSISFVNESGATVNPNGAIRTNVEYREPMEYILKWAPNANTTQRVDKATRRYYAEPMNPYVKRLNPTLNPNRIFVVTTPGSIVTPISTMDALLPASSIVLIRENTFGKGKAISIRLNFLFFDPSLADFNPTDTDQQLFTKTARSTLRAKSVIFFSNTQPDDY
jgi:hypothetical protein